MKLIIAGIIQDQGYFDKHVKPYLDENSIIYLGSAGPEKRNKLLGGAYALLHPISFNEPFGLSIVEAMACGTPIIAFNRGSMPEIISDGITGFLVHNLDEMIKAVSKIKQINRSQCHKLAKERFSVDRMIKDYIKVYEKIVNRKEV